MSNSNLRVFGLGSSQEYADQVCNVLGIKRSLHLESWRDDDEPQVMSRENVRGTDVFIVQSLYSCQNERLSDKFLKLLLFARSLRDASARRITLVVTFLAFQRQDRKTESRAAVYTKYIPEIMEGVLRPDDRILTMDVHNLSAFQSGNRLMLDHLESKPLVANWFSNNVRNVWPDIDLNNMCFLSPDEGGAKRNGFYRKKIQSIMKITIGGGAVYKTHDDIDDRLIHAHGIMGNVSRKDCFVTDDLISGASTLVAATNTIEKHNGRVRGVIATHGLFVGRANDNVRNLLKRGVKVIVTDTIHTNKLDPDISKEIIVIPTARLFAEAIRCIHNEESVSRLISAD